MNEIFILESIFRKTKKRSQKYFKSLKGAVEYANKYLNNLDVTIRIYPQQIYE